MAKRRARTFRERKTNEWLEALVANDVVLHTRDPRAGGYRGLGFPLTLSAAPARLRHHALALGAHTRRILAELGYAPAEVRRLLSARAVRAAE